MKNILLLLLLIIALFSTSCNNKQKVKEKVTDVAASTETNTPPKKRLTPEEQDKIYSLSLIAWGDARFGMTIKQALATETFKNARNFENETLYMSFDQNMKFEKHLGLERLGQITADFEENELYRINITSMSTKIRDIDKIINDCDIFIKNFTEKYGEPSYKKKEIRMSDFYSGDEFEYAEYQIGSKYIAILLGENKVLLSNYNYRIIIGNSAYPKKRHVPTEKEKREKEKEVEDAKKTKEISF